MSYGYLRLSRESFENIIKKPNIFSDIPESGYNFAATNYICSQMAEEIKNCVFLDTAEVLLAKSRSRALELIIEACLSEKTISGEIPINPRSGQMDLLGDILQIARQTLTQNEYDNRRFVAPLTITGSDKEAHGAALCIEADKRKRLVNIMIVEQHARRDGSGLDFSEEIKIVLSALKKVFEDQGVGVNILQNDKSVCRQKGVCGIVSAEICRRLLRSEDPMRDVRSGFAELTREDIKNLHKENFLNYQNKVFLRSGIECIKHYSR